MPKFRLGGEKLIAGDCSMTVKTESILKAIKGFKEMGKPASGTFQKVGNEIGNPPPPR